MSRTRTLAAGASAAALIGAGILAATPAQAAKPAPDNALSMAKLRSPLVANWKSPPFADVQLVLSRVPPFALACRMR